jgi:hypothetical protein
MQDQSSPQRRSRSLRRRPSDDHCGSNLAASITFVRNQPPHASERSGPRNSLGHFSAAGSRATRSAFASIKSAVIDRRENIVRFCPSPLLAPQPCETGRGAQFQRLRVLVLRGVDRLLVAGLRPTRDGVPAVSLARLEVSGLRKRKPSIITLGLTALGMSAGYGSRGTMAYRRRLPSAASRLRLSSPCRGHLYFARPRRRHVRSGGLVMQKTPLSCPREKRMKSMGPNGALDYAGNS